MTLFFYGSNSYGLQQQLQQMVSAYLKKAGSDFGLERIDGAGVKLIELKAALLAVPFLASSRLVIIDGLIANKAVSEHIAELIALVPKSTVAVFIEREVDRRTVLFRELSKADKVIKFEQLSGPSLLGWVRAEIQKLSGTIEPTAIRELVDLAGEDQWRLHNEITKLVTYNKEVTSSSIKALVIPNIERSIFELVENMAAGKTAQAIMQYKGLLEQKESEMYVLTMIQWQLRNLLIAKTAPASMSPQDLAKAAGMSPFVAGKMAAIQHRISEPKLIASYQQAVEVEYAIKTGAIRSEMAVEQLIYQVASINAT